MRHLDGPPSKIRQLISHSFMSSLTLSSRRMNTPIGGQKLAFISLCVFSSLSSHPPTFRHFESHHLMTNSVSIHSSRNELKNALLGGNLRNQGFHKHIFDREEGQFLSFFFSMTLGVGLCVGLCFFSSLSPFDLLLLSSTP